MTVKTGAAWNGTFVTLSATGAVTAATGTPVGTLYVDGVANAASVTITGANPYKWAVTLPALTAGQRVDMYITATVSAVATGGIVASDQADTALPSDLATTLGVPAGASIAADIAAMDTTAGAIAADVTTLLARLTEARTGYLDALAGFTGTIRQALRAMATKAPGEASSDLTGGSSTYDLTTDSPEAIRDRGDAAWTTGSSVLGSGSESVRVRCMNGASPVDGAAVWITTDSAGTNVVAGTVYTTATGYTATLMLDPGTYYVWRQASGVNFTNPQTITVVDA